MAQTYTFKKCPQCFKRVPEDSVSCNYCGLPFKASKFQEIQEEPEAPKVKLQAPVQTYIPGVQKRYILDRCPACDCADVKLISYLAAQGSWQKQESGVIAGGGYIDHVGAKVNVARTSVRGSGASELAISLSPPTRPMKKISSKRKSMWLPFWGWVFAAMALGALFASPLPKNDSTGTLFVAIMTGIGLIIGLSQTISKEKQIREDELAMNDDNSQESQDWARKMIVWERCYHCSKCDSVIDPARGIVAPRSQFQSLLS